MSKKSRVYTITILVGAVVAFLLWSPRSPIGGPKDVRPSPATQSGRGSNGDTSRISPQESGSLSRDVGSPSEPMGEMTPQRAKELFAEAATMKNIQEQARLYRNTMAELCLAGYTKEAWEMMLSDPGYNRDSQVGAFFLNAHLGYIDLVNKISELGSSREKESALGCIFARNINRYNTLLEDPLFMESVAQASGDNPDALAKAIGKGLRIGIDLASNDSEREEATQSAVELYSEGMISDENFSYILSRNMSKSPFSLWEWISDSSLGRSDPESFEGKMRQGIIDSMINEDAPEALSQLATNSGDLGLENLYDGLYSWAFQSPIDASRWYQQKSSNLDSGQQDITAKVFADLAIFHGEYDGALSWAQDIKDSTLREEVLNKINSK